MFGVDQLADKFFRLFVSYEQTATDGLKFFPQLLNRFYQEACTPDARLAHATILFKLAFVEARIKAVDRDNFEVFCRFLRGHPVQYGVIVEP